MTIDTLPHPPGTRVSWKSQITGQRHFGIVVQFVDSHYKVRTGNRMVLTLHQSRVTKECD